jgi:hypothetical protein
VSAMSNSSKKKIIVDGTKARVEKKIRDKINEEFANNERLDDADGNVPGL